MHTTPQSNVGILIAQEDQDSCYSPPLTIKREGLNDHFNPVFST